MTVIPAIDIIEGKCVRLTKGDYSTRKTYGNDPLSQARIFEDAGLTRLHLVDLEGARAKEPRNLVVLQKLANLTNLVIDYGGGMYTRESLDAAFDAGASFVTCGSLAVRDPDEAISWMETYGERIILGADCIDGKVALSAWSEGSGIDVVPFIKSFTAHGIKYCISTDVSKDGMLTGPGWDLYERILSSTDVRLIASGGISSKSDLTRLASMGLSGAIVGKAYYEGKITLEELREVEECSQKG